MWGRNTMYLVSSFDSDSDHFSPEEADWGADEVDFIVFISLSFVNSWSFENSCRPCLTNLWTSILRSWCLSQRRTFLVNLKNWKKNEKCEEEKNFLWQLWPGVARAKTVGVRVLIQTVATRQVESTQRRSFQEQEWSLTWTVNTQCRRNSIYSYRKFRNF